MKEVRLAKGEEFRIVYKNGRVRVLVGTLRVIVVNGRPAWEIVTKDDSPRPRRPLDNAQAVAGQ